MKVRGVRGAITVSGDNADEICEATQLLMKTMVRENDIDPDDVASVFFTMTSDLKAMYPAVSARQLEWKDVPLICVQELKIEGSLPKCIRILMHWNTSKTAKEVQHVYLREATKLRPDLIK